MFPPVVGQGAAGVGAKAPKPGSVTALILLEQMETQCKCVLNFFSYNPLKVVKLTVTLEGRCGFANAMFEDRNYSYAALIISALLSIQMILEDFQCCILQTTFWFCS